MKTNEKFKKAIISGLGNDGYLFRYSFKKGNLNSEVLKPFMIELGFEEDKISEEFFMRYTAFNGGEERPYYVKNFLDDKENIFELRNKKFDVELVCFSKENVLRIRTKAKEKLLSLVKKFFLFENENK